ncbi:uncharacterized protein LOC109915445 [Rhincodon typus]|uniref:uncharacterized protein LOC109915445 n=1 Tax=Rhincodon typus TaxID=259920 RepID=UPI00202EA96E|nr:uncharacterized protein LOC109915445 [Rhincodon typus]XP_048454246.1 uncharacterized protein LOC109915445 [Rhincodon typus]
MASIAQLPEAVEKNKISSTDIQVRNRKVGTSMNIFLQSKKAKQPLKQSQKGNTNPKPYRAAELCLSAKLNQENKDKLEICLLKHSLEIKNSCFPEIVKEMYKATYPPKSKKPLSKPVAPCKGFKKPRLLYLPFIEQDAVDLLELNLKHKQLTHLWGFPTQYEESVAMMIPEVPPEPPAIKASGTQIEFVGEEATFLDNKIKDRLEWHIAQKKLQHNWGFPLHVQRSQENFISPAPKLIPFHVKPKFLFVTICVPAELPFLSDGHRKLLELNTRKRIINCRWGLPKVVQSSLNSFIPVAPQAEDFILESQHQTMPIFIVPTSSGNIIRLRKKLSLTKQQRIIKMDKNVEIFFSDNQMVTRGAVIEFSLIKQCLEIKMENLPKLVTDAYSSTYAKVPKKILPKTILPGKGFKKQKSSYLPFIEQEAVDRLELNLMQKQITHEWGISTLYEESLEMMIPVGPPLPPLIKASEAQIEPVGMENNFIKNKVRDRLELHITQKKLQYSWGLPVHIQRSLELFIPSAPKFVPIQVNSQPDFAVVVAPSELAFLTEDHRQTLNRNIKKRIINRKWGLPKIIQSSLMQFMAPTPDDNDFMQPSAHCKESSTVLNNNNLGRSYKIFSQSTNLRLKGGKLFSQYETDEMNLNKVKEIATNVILRSQYKENLHISLIRQCLEIKIDCLPELVKDLYKRTYPVASKRPLPKLVAPGRGFKKPRVRYISFIKQDDIDLIEMNLKHRQLSCLCGFETLYDKSMEMMIPKGPPLPPSIKPNGVQIEHAPQPTTAFSDGVKEFLEWHILQKKLQHTWGLPSHVQKSTKAFIPPAPKLIVTQLNPQPGVQIVIALTELEFISDEHQKALEINVKKRIVNHRWGLPQLIQSSLNEFMTPPPPIQDFVQQIKVKRNCGVRCRTVGLSNDYKMISSQHASLLTKEQKSTLHYGSLKESVKVKKKERRMSTLAELRSECSNKLNMCLIKQSLSIKLDCLPELVMDLYKQTYPPALKKSLPKLRTHIKGFRKTRLPYILFAEQDIVHRLDMNLKHKQINYLWGVATIFDESMEMMIPKAPPLLPVIKPSGAKIEHKGMELAFQSTEIIEILEWHIITKNFEYQWGIPLHIQQSIDKFIPSPPKLVRSHFSQSPDFDISVSINELIFLSEEFKKTLEINTSSRIISQRQGIPNIIRASLNSFIPPVPPGNDIMPQLQTGGGSTTGFSGCELSKINTILSSEQKSCACTISLANSENDTVSSCVDSLEEFSVSPKLETKDEMNADVTKQSLEMQSVYKCSYSATSKSLLKLNTPYRRLRKQNLKSKWGDDCLEVEYPIASPSYRPKSMKTVGSSTWPTNQKLADLTYKPMTIVGLSLGPATIEANVPSSPMIVQEDFSVYLKQNMGSAFLPRPDPYADCEEILPKNARDVGNDVSCSEQLTEEAKNHIQQGEEHGYVKIIAGAIVNNQKEEQKVQVDLSEIICAKPTPTGFGNNTLQKRMIVTSQDPDDGNYLSVSDEELHGAYYENLNKLYHTSRTHSAKKKCKKTFQSRYSSQTKPDKTLIKSKAKFSKQDCQRSRLIKHNGEGTKPELGNENILFVSPAEELWSETNQKEKSSSFSSYCDQAESPMSAIETLHSCRNDDRSSQSSTANSQGCQQALSHEDSPFATNKDCEVYYQCESPLLSHTVH